MVWVTRKLADYPSCQNSISHNATCSKRKKERGVKMVRDLGSSPGCFFGCIFMGGKGEEGEGKIMLDFGSLGRASIVMSTYQQSRELSHRG